MISASSKDAACLSVIAPATLTARPLKGVDVALLFLHKRLCGPLANSRFHHQSDPANKPNSKLEAAYHKADQAIENIVNLLKAA
jgi:hypothetical protein